MHWITLIGDEKLNIDVLKTIEHYHSINSYDVNEIKDRYCIDYGKDYIFYDASNNIINDYEESDLKKIPFKNPHFIMMIYMSEERMKKVIQQDNFLKEIYIDNDHGLIMPIAEYIKIGMPVDTINTLKFKK